jgi:plasmid stability protein
MKRLTIRLDDEVHRRLKIAAAERGTSIQQIVARLLQEDLERHGLPHPQQIVARLLQEDLERHRPPRRLQRERGR